MRQGIKSVVEEKSMAGPHRGLGGLIAVICLVVSSAQAVPLSTKIWSPFFNMNVSQAAYFPAGGDFFEGARVNMSLGANVKRGSKDTILGLYNMNFEGAGFQFPDSKEFSSKDLLHHFSAEYRWQTGDTWRLRPSFVYGNDLTRTAAGEIWGVGLYDNHYLGGGLAWDYAFLIKKLDANLTVQWLFRNVKFPNYSDIVREFQGLASNVELAGGLKDQVFNEFGASLDWNHMYLGLRANALDFTNERVVESNGTYGGTKQKDTNFVMTLAWERQHGVLLFTPSFVHSGHGSNQNFLLFESLTDSMPEFAVNYYDFRDEQITLPLLVNMGLKSKWAWNFAIDYRYRAYSNRLPRSVDDVFVQGETQHNGMFTLSTGLKKRINDISAWTLTYAFVHANSNNHFERYLPYNYYGNSLALGYQLTY